MAGRPWAPAELAFQVHGLCPDRGRSPEGSGGNARPWRSSPWDHLLSSPQAILMLHSHWVHSVIPPGPRVSPLGTGKGPAPYRIGGRARMACGCHGLPIQREDQNRTSMSLERGVPARETKAPPRPAHRLECCSSRREAQCGSAEAAAEWNR